MKIKTFIIFLLCNSVEVLLAESNTISFSNTIDLGVSKIYCGLQSNKNNMFWFGTENGIIAFNGLITDNFNQINNKIGIPVLDIIENKKGKIIMILENNLMGYYDNNTFKYKNFINTIPNLKEFKLIKINNQIFLYNPAKFNTNKFRIFMLNDDLTIFKIQENFLSKLNKEIIIKKDNAWFSKANVYDLDLKLIYNSKNTIIYDVIYDNKLYYIATSKGLILIDKYNNFTKRFFKNQEITSCFIDHNKNIVICTNNGKIHVSNKFNLVSIYKNNDISIVNFKNDGDKILFADENLNLNSFNKKTNISKILFRNNNAKNNNSIFIKNDNIYFNKLRIKNSLNIKINYVPFQSITLNQNNYLLTTGYSDIKLVNLKNQKIKTIYYDSFWNKKGYYNKIYQCIYHKSNIYVASKDGLLNLNFDTIKLNCKLNKIYSNQKPIKQIDFYNENIWYLTYQNELNLIVKNKVYYNVLSKIHKNYLINCVKSLNDSSFIIGTNNGLIAFKYSTINSTLSIKEIMKLEIFNGTYIGNIIGIDFDTTNLYFSNKHSVFSFNHKFVESDKYSNSDKLYIEWIEANNKIFYNLNNKIILEPLRGQLKVKMNMSSIRLNKLNENYNYVLLKDNDTLLNSYSDKYMLTFNSLKSGTYKLIYNLNNLNFNQNEVLYFDVKPKFNETIQYKLLIILFFIFLIIVLAHFIYRIKMNKIKVRNMVIENENFNLKILKSQLNPHFIFNSLNSLKGIIHFNQNKKAMTYIDLLSTFFRNSLSVNEITVNTLYEEIKIIENYIALENFRVENKIKFNNNVNINKFEMVVPSNILQVIVENSIVHGYINNKTLVIDINCLEREKWNEIQIFNNGQSIENSSFDKHKSFGLQSIEKRLSIFNNSSFKTNLEVQNLFEEKNYIGVICKIKIKK